ncbi:MAG TPA: YerC/YecD family TrpR-related protein [Bacillota bacterium]|nr:YerC/YecD family TrpR-related protein [Bacillota bacterium]
MEKIAQQSDVQMFYRAVLNLKNLEECHMFFMDICTINEIQTIAQRLQVAQLLDQGNTYVAIEQITGASTATISRVKRSVQYGAGGYDFMLPRLRESAPQSNTEDEID